MANAIAISKHRAALARVRARGRGVQDAVMRTGGIAAASALIGFLESKGSMPVGFFKNASGQPMIPTKVAISLAAAAGAAVSHGTMRQVLSALADGAAAAYGYNAGKQQQLVAGDE